MKPLYLVATIRPRTDRLEDAREALQALMKASRAEVGCELYDLVASDDRPGTWLMLEKWASRAHWDAHMRSEHNATFGSVANSLMAEPITLAFYDPA